MTNELIYKTETDTQDNRTNLTVARTEGLEARDKKFRVNTYALLYLQWITHKKLLDSTQNSAQCYVADWIG